MTPSLSFFHRLLTAIVGFITGGFLGMLVLYLLMVSVGSDFGLDNVRPGVIFGAAIGFFFGLWRPRRWSWLDFLAP